MAALVEKQRRNGNIDAIMDGFASKSVVDRAQAICGAVNHDVINDAIERNLQRLADDGSVVMGYSISQLSIAVLDKLGVITYVGKDDTILNLIQAKKWFDE